MIFSPVEIQETVNMFMRQKLDIRAITLGINLLDCACDDGKTSRRKMYDKIMKYASRLVPVGREIETEFGVPIINKRIAVTPMLRARAGKRILPNGRWCLTGLQKSLTLTLSAAFPRSCTRE